MSLRFYFGSSGAGKSYQLYQEMIERSAKHPEQNFLVLVPDQFTMQTQRELVLRHPDGVIRNIDVLSFGRLSHRIFEEVGYDRSPVLDDTGKSLVLRKIAGTLKEQLPVLGGNLDKPSYIHEVKSAISEFMQYGIGTKELDQLVSFAAQRGALHYKLKDLQTLYEAFLSYIEGQFITTEETLDLLRNSLSKSGIIQGSVVAFDGFTGFTPIQNRLIQELMQLCEEVIVTVTIPEGEDPFKIEGEQQLFYLSKKTVRDLCKLAEEDKIARGKDVFLTGDVLRFQKGGQLAHLEKSLFRYPLKPYVKHGVAIGATQATQEDRGTTQEGRATTQEDREATQGTVDGAASYTTDSVRIYEATDPKEEVRQTARLIRQLIREKGYQFREIAVICGDLGTYAEYVEEQFALFEIPVFLDQTRGILLNPFIEYIRSALSILTQDFSYESVFHYLRSGLADFTREETDWFENYVLQFGIRGKWQYTRVFTKKTKEMAEDADSFDKINAVRQRLLDSLQPLLFRENTVKSFVEGLYDFLVQSRVQEKLAVYEKQFEEKGELSKAREYAQIYPLVMDLLDQIIGLLGEEKMTLKEFADILDAGFGEIEVGIIPQNVDRVVAGDMERTRLKPVRALFFLVSTMGIFPEEPQEAALSQILTGNF